jgi:2-oxoglutarate dehydrogenase E2 component (dihydrolipoamide succinyltransferase)
MATPVLMPQLGESVNEGTISKWLKAIGDKVEEYEPLVEVNTDKVDTEIAAPASGVLLKTLVEVGATVSAGTVLAMIGKEGESTAESAPAEPPPAAAAPAEQSAPAVEKQPEAAQAAPAPAAAPQPEGRELGFISPVVARIASEHKVDLSQISGTGMGGRITKKDVLAYVEQRQAQPQAAPAQPAAPAKPAPTPQPAAAVSGKLESDLIPHTNLRRLIAEHMVHSKHTSPHVTTVMEADLSRVMQHRSANKDAFAKDGVNLTFTAYFISAIVSALKAYPIVNSSWSDEGILVHRHINIGMATSLGEDGLIVPVIKQADSLSLLGLARTINDLANRARARKLQPDEVKDGTFTITNHGISGSLFASPVINQPQCAILGTGAIQKRAVVISDEKLGDVIAIRPMVYASLTFDHRILDGASADNFLAKVVESLNNY